MNKVVLYARSATSREAVDRQFQTMEERMASGAEIVGRYSDVGSGLDCRLPGLQEAFQQVSIGNAEGLMVASLDRITRSIQKLVRLKSMFRIKVCEEPSDLD